MTSLLSVRPGLGLNFESQNTNRATASANLPKCCCHDIKSVLGQNVWSEEIKTVGRVCCCVKRLTLAFVAQATLSAARLSWRPWTCPGTGAWAELCKACWVNSSPHCGSSTWWPAISLRVTLLFWVLTEISHNSTVKTITAVTMTSRSRGTCSPCRSLSLSGGIVSALRSLCVLDVSCNPQLAQEVGGFSQLTAALCHAASIATLRFHACGLTAHSVDALSRRFYFYSHST